MTHRHERARTVYLRDGWAVEYCECGFARSVCGGVEFDWRPEPEGDPDRALAAAIVLAGLVAVLAFAAWVW